jgi:hypothetical protein
MYRFHQLISFTYRPQLICQRGTPRTSIFNKPSMLLLFFNCFCLFELTFTIHRALRRYSVLTLVFKLLHLSNFLICYLLIILFVVPKLSIQLSSRHVCSLFVVLECTFTRIGQFWSFIVFLSKKRRHFCSSSRFTADSFHLNAIVHGELYCSNIGVRTHFLFTGKF